VKDKPTQKDLIKLRKAFIPLEPRFVFEILSMLMDEVRHICIGRVLPYTIFPVLKKLMVNPRINGDNIFCIKFTNTKQQAPFSYYGAQSKYTDRMRG